MVWQWFQKGLATVRMVCDGIGMISLSLWDRFEIVLESFWDPLGWLEDGRGWLFYNMCVAFVYICYPYVEFVMNSICCTEWKMYIVHRKQVKQDLLQRRTEADILEGYGS